ncbi:HNH endonuclease [Pseudoclavibacter sp. RFBG4]|uniref:HNH endonuclease n=1 Tax=Pseudoclavibacter sp. RFBG4 TaxID=2080575 RepID=UPI0011B0BF28|nr:HNH endonuclease [Pseudoclavibacter sp. RFBG4]
MSAPVWLEDNKVTRTKEYLEAPSGAKPTPWRAKEVVAQLKVESAGKCMYCESFVDDVSYAAVEHVRPKSKFPDQVLEWGNLGIVCTRCNTNKGSYWTDDESLTLINPYQDDVEAHLSFHGPMTMARVGSSRGENTVRKLQFSQRVDLLISRAAQMENLYTLITAWATAEDGSELKELRAEDVRAAIGKGVEYAGVLRAFARRSGFPVTGD